MDNNKSPGMQKPNGSKNVLVEEESDGSPVLSLNTIYLNQHMAQLKYAKSHIDRLKDELGRMELTVLKKDGTIYELETKIKDCKCHQYAADIKKAESECLRYRVLYVEENRKVCVIETEYDQKVHDMQENYKNLSLRLSDEHQVLVDQVKTLTAELQTTRSDNDLKQQKLSQYENDLTALKDTFELKMEKLQTDLKERDEMLNQCHQKYHELETTKNKIIHEQAYKLKQMDGLRDQQTLLVPRVTSPPKITNLNAIEDLQKNKAPIVLPIENNPLGDVNNELPTNLAAVRSKFRLTHALKRNLKYYYKNFYDDNSTTDEDDTLPIESWRPISPKEKKKASSTSPKKKRKLEDEKNKAPIVLPIENNHLEDVNNELPTNLLAGRSKFKQPHALKRNMKYYYKNFYDDNSTTDEDDTLPTESWRPISPNERNKASPTSPKNKCQLENETIIPDTSDSENRFDRLKDKRHSN